MSREVASPLPAGTPDELFAGLTGEQTKAVLLQARPIQVRRGEFLFRQDDPAIAIFQLTRGRMKLCQASEEGHQVVLRLIGPGQLFGMRSLNGDGPYRFSAQALQASEALSWKKEAFADLTEDNPQLVNNLLSVLLDRSDEYQVRLRDLMNVSIEKRLARTLLQLADEFGAKSGAGTVVDGGFTLKDLAEMTGTTLFTASRVTSNWQRARILKKERGALILRNLSRLGSIAK